MKEIFLSFSEANDYVRSREAVAVGNLVSEIRDGKIYKKQLLLCPLSFLATLIKLIQALVSTVFTAFLALFSKSIRTLWGEALNGYKSRAMLLPRNINDYLDKDTFTSIFKECTIPEICGLASVCKKFNTLGNSPEFWRQVAVKKNITLHPNNPDFKVQVINAVIPLSLGSVNIGKKKITWERIAKQSTENLNFFKEAIALFGVNYFFTYHKGEESTMYVYCDQDGIIKHIRESESTNETAIIRESMTRIHCEQLDKRHQLILEAIFMQPIPSNIVWTDIESLMQHLKAEIKVKGFHVRFELNGVRAAFARPRTKPETNKGTLVLVRRFLENAGVKP